MAATQVVGHIHGLHRDFANTQAHSTWLQQFQQAPEAWSVAHELLLGSNDELVQHFAAHTLVTKLQAGNIPTGGACHQDLMRYLAHFCTGPISVRRQLVVALVDFALWRPPAEDDRWFSDSVQQLSQNVDAVVCLLELLACIPEEVVNRKVVIDSQRRQGFANNMLRHTGVVLDALCKASQTSVTCAIVALKALARWLALQHANPVLRAQKRSTCGGVGGSGPFTVELVRLGNFAEHPLLLQAGRVVEGVGSNQLELCRACCDLLSEVLSLTNETTVQARSVLLLVVNAVVAAAKQLLPHVPPGEAFLAPESELVQRLALIGRLVGELGGVFARLVVADGIAARQANLGGLSAPPAVGAGLLGELSKVGLSFCTLRNTDLAKCGLDFWYGVLAQHLGAAAEEDDPFDEDADRSVGLARRDKDGGLNEIRNMEQERARRAEEGQMLAPYIQDMVRAHWRAVRYPAEPEREEHFEWDDFVRFRETCSINITEACTIVTPAWIIEHVGSLLSEICSREIAWQDIDACVFLLTGVASRAPAGQDTVIPRLIELLPQLPYPTQGFKALLLRCAASRLVLFTSGYLALNPEPCKKILQFLTMQHLPAIPLLTAAPVADAKKYGEALACDAMKMVMSSARKAIVVADGGTLWKEVVAAVIGLVSDTRFNVDCRAQLVFGIGQVLSVLSDWGELEQMLGLFVARMQGPLKPIFDQLPAEPLGSRAVKTTRDGKAPVEVKLYIAAVSSVYNIPSQPEDLRPDHHPVLAVVEQNFATIERICLHHTQYEDLMEQVCLAFSYILGFSREYAPNSPVFVPMMKLMARCCEQHPNPFYMGLVRSVVGFFADDGSDQLDTVLVDLTGLFIAPISRRLADAFNGAAGTCLPPPLNAAAYEMLAETLRHWNLTLLAIRNSTWMTEVLDSTLEIMPRLAEENQVVHEKTVCAMLRFLRNLLLWADHETYKSDQSPELQEVQRQAQAIIGERALPRGPALPRLILAVARLLAAAAPNAPSKGEVAPCVGELLRSLFTGPFEFQTTTHLPSALRLLPRPFGDAMTDSEQQRLLQQLKMEKGDSRRFVRSVVGIAEQFAVCLKKAQFGA